MKMLRRKKPRAAGKEGEGINDLASLPMYGVCRVTGVDECAVRPRLEGLGITEGAEIVALFSAPSGDPTAYSVRGAVVALRRSDAERIRVRGSAAWE